MTLLEKPLKSQVRKHNNRKNSVSVLRKQVETPQDLYQSETRSPDQDQLDLFEVADWKNTINSVAADSARLLQFPLSSFWLW